MLRVVELEESTLQAVRRELACVLSSPAFSRNDRQSQFLRFLVERHLEGRDSELKESVIAVEVFGRKADYDPKLDAIVRTEAVRLRARLERYYAGEGRRDPLIIELPKGGYRPVFREPAPAPDAQTPRPAWTRRIAAALVTAGIVTVAMVWVGMVGSRARPGASPSVAVLPLENLSHDLASDYFADGLTDEIIRNLSVVDGLTVRSRTSSFALKGQRLNAFDAGRQLQADYLVEGSVLQVGERLRVNAELIRVGDDFHVWSGRFDRELADVFAVQDEISRGIVNGLRLKVGPSRRRYETNLEAYELYLRGRQVMEGFPVALALARVKIGPPKPPRHAPAPAARPPRAEQLLQVRPALGGQRVKFQLAHRFHVSLLGPKSETIQELAKSRKRGPPSGHYINRNPAPRGRSVA